MFWTVWFDEIVYACSFMTWRDLVEILFFSFGTYAAIRLLAQDKQKSLLPFFYAYCSLFFVSFYLSVTGLVLVLALCAPVTALFFMLVHQKTLQKNFITLASPTLQAENTEQWLPELVQGALHAVNTGKSTIVIIERTNSLQEMLVGGHTLNASVTSELLAFLVRATTLEQPLVIWMSQSGKIRGINPTIQLPYESVWLDGDVQLLDRFLQDALILSEKSDALIWTLSAQTRFFTLTLGGKVFDRLSATALLSTVARYLKSEKVTEKENYDLPLYKDRSGKQTRP